MSQSIESVLPGHIRKVFEQYGVIKPASWPKLDSLVKSITTRKFRYDIQTDQMGVVTARVFAQGNTYTAIDGEPERALAKAFHECLVEVGSSQLEMFENYEEDDDDGKAALIDKAFNSLQNAAGKVGVPMTISSAERTVQVNTPARTSKDDTFELDEQGRYINRATGEILDPTDVPMASAGGR